jgi:GTPase SAR1 family protein
VVVGNQSAGKSSTLSALTGVALPRSDSTTTRCVFDIRIRKQPQPWSCSIELRVDDKLRAFCTLDEKQKSSLPEKLTQAQCLLLQPPERIDDEMHRFLTKNTPIELPAGNRFGGHNDSIRVTITSADVIGDLDLIDLPGIITNRISGPVEQVM